MTSTAQPPVTTGPSRTGNRRALLGLGLGNTLEWYDWQIAGLLAALLGPKFFPGHDSLASTLNALAVFAVGFAVRPLGGVVLGTVADRIGRRAVMLLSVAIMAVATLVIAILPGYQQIGLWAGVMFVACRLAQGLSTGVEAPLSTAYAMELAPKGREGRYAGVISLFVNIGILGASLVSFVASGVLGNAAMASWGWRVPFAVGALLGVVVIYLRRSLPETLHDVSTPDEAPAASTAGVWRQVGRHWIGLLAILFVVGAAQAFNYAWNVGLPSLARGAFHENSTAVFGLTTLLGLVLVIGSPIVGALADRRKLSRVFLVTRMLAIPTMFLMLAYTARGIGLFAAVLLVGGVVLVANMTLYNAVSTSLMPKACRAAGCGIGYGVAVALFGGTASYLLVWLQQQHRAWLFAAYAAALCAVSVVLYLVARRRSGVFVAE
ncbi:MFS transporter [Gandjariella thermophila]|uniref:MFS transporter n=1 Tax=Gandjariella thermophila TaxID=1931992 RepID=A0A4D4JFP1_9PSEU|nr:MFS transporter [Gandjariella thermophila]GDY32717.1 MFS transporter [Gandjariella thermophila]